MCTVGRGVGRFEVEGGGLDEPTMIRFGEGLLERERTSSKV